MSPDNGLILRDAADAAAQDEEIDFSFRISVNSRAMATKPETGTVSARRVGSTSAAAVSRNGSAGSDFRLWRSILRRWLKAAAATCSSARRSQGAGASRGTSRTTDDVTL